MKKIRSQIAQIIIDMNLLERKEVKRKHMIKVIEEVNNSQMIGHAVMFIKDKDGAVTHIKKYRKTNIEKQLEKERINKLKK